ncbi:phage tail protein, partial [Salinivibrio sp. VYel6]|uniref:portal protein n=1 Tax=Salinivibrio sp. VYel6 TaxID=2490493 RepID=UPI00128B2632|nr:phage tail protein [Salinivibrio sp. VYel6]
MTVKLEDTYRRLASEREPYLSRGRLCSGLTIPSILPEEGQDGSTQFAVPYSGFGARAIKQLAAKMLLALFPPSQSFVRIKIDEKHLAKFSLDEQGLGQLEQALSKTEEQLVSEVEQRGLRTVLYEAMKQLLVTGNTLLFVGRTATRLYRLDKYVMRRDADGHVYEIIVSEDIQFEDLPDDLKQHVAEQQENKPDAKKEIKVYTHIYRDGKKWRSHQEVMGVVVDKSHSTYREDRCPWIPLTMNLVDGETYARSFTEEHLGDLNTLESLTKAITQASVAASKVVFLVRPNASTRPANIQKAKNGEVIQGDSEDVSCLQLDKAHDLSIAKTLSAEITAGLSESFLMNSAIRRDAERVTAEEIRVMSRMLEESLGGVYSQLAGSLQLPLVNVLLGHMSREGTLPHFQKGVFKPVVLTGVEGLGREADLNHLNMFINLIQQVGT